MSTVEPYFDNNFLLPTLKIQSDSAEIKALLNDKKLFEGVDFPSLNIILCKLDLNNK